MCLFYVCDAYALFMMAECGIQKIMMFLLQCTYLSTSLLLTPNTYARMDNIPSQRRIQFWKEDTMAKVISGKVLIRSSYIHTYVCRIGLCFLPFTYECCLSLVSMLYA